MIDTQIQEISSEQLDQLFGENPGTKVDTTTGGGDNKEVKVIASSGSGFEDIPTLPEDEMVIDESLMTDDEKEAKAKLDKETKAKDKAAAKETKEKEEFDALSEEEKAEKIKAKEIADQKAKDKAEKDKVVEETPEVKEVLKNTVEFLIKSGQWEDFEGREDLEMTQETYANLAAKQNEYKVNAMFDELVDETGDYGKAIISHIKGGGNPDEVIDIFKEQKAVEAIDTTKEEGKQALIEKYYRDVKGLKPEKVTKMVKRLIEDNEIESEFTEVKEQYDAHHKERLAAVTQELEEEKKAKLVKQQQFVTSIKTALQEEASIPAKDKKLIESSILDFKHKLDNGQKVNDFYVKFAKMQADPKEYIKLVRFVMNPEGFEKQIEAKKGSEAAKNTFNFIKGNSAIQKTKGSALEIKDREPAHTGTNFSFALKK